MEATLDPKTTSSPPPQQEPVPKKPKMFTTETSDDEIATTGGEATIRKQKFKRRKIAILFAYCGVGYQGMQKNPGAKTIEGDLEEALFHSNAIPEEDRGRPQRFEWARSARTDKGVSAVGQVVSGRFYVDPPGFIERLNSNLSPQIRIFGYKRVTASFNAKKFCDRRRYVYLIPVFALDPSAHRDRESVLASLGSDGELVKCLECSERGRKVAGAVGKRTFESKSEVAQTDISSKTEDANGKTEVKGEIVVSMDNGTDVKVDKQEIVVSMDNGTDVKVDEQEIVVSMDNGVGVRVEERDDHQEEIVVSKDNAADGNVEEKVVGSVVKGSDFCYGEAEKERFGRILKSYVGTHNFHNFTTRIKAEDPSAKRFIISFEADTVLNVEGMEFVKCEVVGQSFMLHQIRKMIGLAVAIMRNCAPESLLQTALRTDVRITVPTAPEVGLYLEECLFSSYNQKWKDTHEEVSMKDYEEEAEEFKMKNIYSHIASTEHKEGSVGLWLHSLNHRNYPDLRASSNDVYNEKESAQAEITTNKKESTQSEITTE